MHKVMSEKAFHFIYIAIPFIILSFSYPYLLFPTIKKHKNEIILLRSSIKEGRNKVNSFISRLRKAEVRVKTMLSLLEKTKNKLPISESTQYGYNFSYYDDDIVIYESDKGIGIKIKNTEKLFKKKDSLSYTLEDEYQYKKFKSNEGNWIKQIYIPQYHFWKGDKQYGFTKLDSNSLMSYKYYARLEKGKVIQEKVTLASKSYYTIRYKDNTQSFYYRFKDGSSISVKPAYSITYKFSKDESYTYYTDSNIFISEPLSDSIFKNVDPQKSKLYIYKILQDWSNSIYIRYLKLLLSKKVPLNKPEQIYLTLINHVREQYDLTPLKVSSTLNKICKLHGDYLLQHKPKYMFLQNRKKKGYFGTTPFQRRKKFKYPNRVVEWFFFGENHIRYFIKARRFRWIYDYLNPKAVHFGYSYCDCRKIGVDGSFGVILIGRKWKIPKGFPLILIYPNPKEKSIPPSTFHTIIKEKNEFCKPPKVETQLEGNLLASIFIYDPNIIIKAVQVKLDGKIIQFKQSQTIKGIINIYTNRPLMAGKKYSIKIPYQYKRKQQKEISASFTIESNHFLHAPF